MWILQSLTDGNRSRKTWGSFTLRVGHWFEAATRPANISSRTCCEGRKTRSSRSHLQQRSLHHLLQFNHIFTQPARNIFSRQNIIEKSRSALRTMVRRYNTRHREEERFIVNDCEGLSVDAGGGVIEVMYRASRSLSSRARISFSFTGPLTFRISCRCESSKNSTRTWVTPPREPVLPRTCRNHKIKGHIEQISAKFQP